MNKESYLFTSESVSEGHPDKVADQISDSILDFFLSHDPFARVAIETLVTTNQIVLAGEVKTNLEFSLDDINFVARDTVKKIGYEQKGFDHRTLSILNYIHGQSADIAMGVDETDSKEEGAGDQGIMFGYACNDTEVLMPFSIYYSHKILEELAKKRKSGAIKGLLPDAKSQVTLEYMNGKPLRVHTVVVSHQHEEHLSTEDVRKLIMPVIKEVLPSNLYNPDDCIHHINPTGRFVIGGPDGDTGLTGRKIIVDTYGGVAPHGGGAFSGKDPTKVDRSAAYAARYLAKNIVASGVASRCTIQLSYAIGVAQPLSVYVDTHGTGKVNDREIEAIIPQLMNLSPKGIRTHLVLNKPIYGITASYGHFGRNSTGDLFTWEKLDLSAKIKNLLKI
ncbi:MAG: methionine adenosyltransferase [Alphaproteobacteria bacterium]|nr:methionine adenosyltransferase [Alphaproteobacteria bacterium]